MQAKDFDELSGRIEGIAQALLRLTAALEVNNILDGHQLSLGWQAMVPAESARTPLRAAARKTLSELCSALDDARRVRHTRLKAG